MAKKPTPLPGYGTNKTLLPSIKLMLQELGEQDACIQLQELAIEQLAKAAVSSQQSVGDFLKPLYRQANVPHGTYNFVELRERASRGYLVVTYALLERMLREVNAGKKAGLVGTEHTWKTKNSDDENLPPLLELTANLPGASAAILKKCPEFGLLEYYRIVRVANSHLKGSTLSRAVKVFNNFSSKDIAHFKKCYGLGAPNSPAAIGFEDFLLFTRAIKYYSRVINEVCA